MHTNQMKRHADKVCPPPERPYPFISSCAGGPTQCAWRGRLPLLTSKVSIKLRSRTELLTSCHSGLGKNVQSVARALYCQGSNGDKSTVVDGEGVVRPPSPKPSFCHMMVHSVRPTGHPPANQKGVGFTGLQRGRIPRRPCNPCHAAQEAARPLWSPRGMSPKPNGGATQSKRILMAHGGRGGPSTVQSGSYPWHGVQWGSIWYPNSPSAPVTGHPGAPVAHQPVRPPNGPPPPQPWPQMVRSGAQSLHGGCSCPPGSIPLQRPWFYVRVPTHWFWGACGPPHCRYSVWAHKWITCGCCCCLVLLVACCLLIAPPSTNRMEMEPAKATQWALEVPTFLGIQPREDPLHRVQILHVDTWEGAFCGVGLKGQS
mmetsp:Transcript_2558/g.4593  ORF Transcript_2558/g.4593 Transcript_2558/m.4593 type:complete len:371 (+) Transcript_2558:3311-4423(+)